MLTTISLLTGLIFAAVYPLCFWISHQDPLKKDFHKFHIGLPNFIGGVVVVSLLFMDIPMPLKITALAWKAVMLSFSSYFWKKGTVSPKAITVPCVLGLVVFALLQNELILKPFMDKGIVPAAAGAGMIFAGILGGFVLCAAVYAMNLGHWYLNVHGLPISHLMRAVNFFWFFLGVRLLWDVYVLFTGSVLYRGDQVSLITFMMNLDGFFIWIAVFFGTLMPIISLYFVRGTLLVKSTQSATGILYVILSAVLIGDLTYKYYLVKYGVAL